MCRELREGGEGLGVKTRSQKREENQEGDKSLTEGREKERSRGGERERRAQRGHVATQGAAKAPGCHLPGTAAVSPQVCPSFDKRTAGKCSSPLSTRGDSSPLRDSFPQSCCPHNLRQVWKLSALIWAEGSVLSSDHPHKAALGMAPALREIPGRVPLPAKLFQGGTRAKGSSRVSTEVVSLSLVSFTFSWK